MSIRDTIKVTNCYVHYDYRDYNVLTYKLPVYLIVEDENGKKSYHWMFLFDTPYLAKEFYDYVKDMLAMGMTLSEREQLVQAYNGHFAMYDRYGKLNY